MLTEELKYFEIFNGHPGVRNYGDDTHASCERMWDITLALRLAQAESALHALSAGQVDAIVDPDGRAYLLRPAQEHLRQNETRLQALLDSAADAITVVDRGGMILSQSQAVRRVLGYESEDLVGRSIFERIHDSDLPQTYAAFFNVIEEFRTDALVEFRHRTRGGSYRLIEAAVAKLRDLNSRSVVFSLRPITGSHRDRPDAECLHRDSQPAAPPERCQPTS